MKRIMFVGFVAAVAAAAFAEGEVAAGGEAETLRVVEAEVFADAFEDELLGPLMNQPDAICCFSAVTNYFDGGEAYWVTVTDKPGWTRLHGAIEPRTRVRYRFRAEIDFGGEATRVRYLVREVGSEEFVLLRDEKGDEWLTAHTPWKKTITGVEVKGGEPKDPTL